jgi:hypothetical protein
MLQNFHAVVSSVVERQGLAVAVGVAGFVGAAVAAAGVVVVVEVAGVEAAVVGNKQLDKVKKSMIRGLVNQNKMCQALYITWRTLHRKTWVWGCLSVAIRLLSCSWLLELVKKKYIEKGLRMITTDV